MRKRKPTRGRRLCLGSTTLRHKIRCRLARPPNHQLSGDRSFQLPGSLGTDVSHFSHPSDWWDSAFQPPGTLGTGGTRVVSTTCYRWYWRGSVISAPKYARGWRYSVISGPRYPWNSILQQYWYGESSTESRGLGLTFLVFFENCQAGSYGSRNRDTKTGFPFIVKKLQGSAVGRHAPFSITAPNLKKKSVRSPHSTDRRR